MGLFNEVREDVVWESVLWFDGGIGRELVSLISFAYGCGMYGDEFQTSR